MRHVLIILTVGCFTSVATAVDPCVSYDPNFSVTSQNWSSCDPMDGWTKEVRGKVTWDCDPGDDSTFCTVSIKVYLYSGNLGDESNQIDSDEHNSSFGDCGGSGSINVINTNSQLTPNTNYWVKFVLDPVQGMDYELRVSLGESPDPCL